MGRRYTLSRPAREDLDDIWLYIARDSIEEADRFIDLLTAKFPLVASQPRMGRLREDLAPNLRCLPVKNYLILYRSLKGSVQIVRVIHGARDPKALFE